MEKLFFISDTHFGAQRTLDLSKRPFNNVKEMDDDLISKWNSKIGKDDVVFHLGDFGDYEYIKKLNGKVILLYGNYEKFDLNKSDPNEFYNRLKDLGFYSQRPSGVMTLDLKDFSVEMVHEPTNATQTMFTLFGHIHGSQKIKEFGLNVGVDCHHYYPVSYEDLLFYKNAFDQKYYDENVFC